MRVVGVRLGPGAGGHSCQPAQARAQAKDSMSNAESGAGQGLQWPSHSQLSHFGEAGSLHGSQELGV